MVRLNKIKLSKAQLKSLFDQFNNTLAKLSSRKSKHLLSEFLGEEEQIMLAKRLAIIILLLEDKSFYYISNTLKVSPATVKKLKLKLDQGNFSELVVALSKNKKEYFSILEALDDILFLGGILPHYNGLDRYRGL